MKKYAALWAALALICGLTACDEKKAEVVPAPPPSVSVSPTPTPEPSSTPPTVDVKLTYDPEALEPWQTAYIQLLEGELERGEVGFAEDVNGMDMPRYYLYDIDKNGVPELILVYDGYYSGIAYTYQQNAVKALNKGTDYYPDSKCLDDYSALVTAPERGINFLPILNYPSPTKADQVPLEQREREEELVKDVIDGDGWFYCVSEYRDDSAGWTTLGDYCQADHTAVAETKWRDLNGDGVQEAVLRSSSHGLILSAQDGAVYGYDIYMETHTLNPRTGTFEDRTRSNGYYDFRVHFAKNQYYAETYYEREAIFPRSFGLGSGSGGWGTELSVAADGTFSGYFQDMDMGGDPPTTYFCRFTGKFSKPEKVDEYTYSVTMEELKKEKAEEWTDEKGMLWVPSIAYGLEGGEEFLIYLPGAPVESLPEYFVQWSAHGYDTWDDDNETLPGYGLYNVKEQYGWYEYE